MKIANTEILMREDQYQLGCFVVENGKETSICNANQSGNYKDLEIELKTEFHGDVFHVLVSINSNGDFACDQLGMYLGIDTYMDTFPEWNDKLFPTALRCEKDGFWSCFSSPNGVMLGVASPSKIISWNHHYSRSYGDVGHRIYTCSVDFINVSKQPQRHPTSPKMLSKGDQLSYDFYFKVVKHREALFDFVQSYAKITVPTFFKHTLEVNEKPVLLTNCGEAFSKKVGELQTNEQDARLFICQDGIAQTELYVRKDWFYYLDCARKSAEICQQKPGTHAESWYGYFSRILYAKYINDEKYTKELELEFDKFFFTLASKETNLLKEETIPHRLQNSSSMLSLLADFYEVIKDTKYLDYANDIAGWLMKLQAPDGSFRCHGTHYTCVIYPAKSMLELALVEKNAGLLERYNVHFDSACKAIENLYTQMDNIETEGEMTFEDGMISCEALQLAFLATLCDEGKDKARFTDAARIILDKHQCLEQWLIPDGRTKGATMRYWEARYDVNFNSNMLNSPHGWTSWKTYATYYLYMLTGELRYLIDTMDTLGACMQCIDKNGILNWAFILNPCVTGNEMVKADNDLGMGFVKRTIGEEYLPMVSDWYRQDDQKLPMQYILDFTDEGLHDQELGGSCDNNVHEHFKCLEETVFGKAFIHFSDNGAPVLYNCSESDGDYRSNDSYVKTFVIRAAKAGTVSIGGKSYPIKPGVNTVNC